MMAARRPQPGPTLISTAAAGELGRQFTVASANAQPAAEAVEAVADEAPVLRTKQAAIAAAVKPQAQPVSAKAQTAAAPTPHQTAKAKALADKAKPKLVAQAKTQDVPHKPAAAPRAAKGAAVIQVGAFSQRSAAERQIDAAQAAVPKLLGDSDPAVVKDSGGKVYRARLAGLTQVQAKQACDTLKRHNIHCAIVANGAS
jgi:D-alanyl-D-alanine carboxypeptidase